MPEREYSPEQQLPEGISVLKQQWMPEDLPVSLLERLPAIEKKYGSNSGSMTKSDYEVIREYQETVLRLVKEWTDLLRTLCPEKEIVDAYFTPSREPRKSIQAWHHDGEGDWEVYVHAHLVLWSNRESTELLHIATNQMIQLPSQSVFRFDNSLYKHRQPLQISPDRFLGRAALLKR